MVGELETVGVSLARAVEVEPEPLALSRVEHGQGIPVQLWPHGTHQVALLPPVECPHCGRRQSPIGCWRPEVLSPATLPRVLEVLRLAMLDEPVLTFDEMAQAVTLDEVRRAWSALIQWSQFASTGSDAEVH